mgnify:CR=1 FL=1
MAYKTIPVHLDGTERDGAALGLALQLAAEEQAHLTRVCFLSHAPSAHWHESISYNH